eukprot:TRINITY_DN13474_c0_g1_i1.p1 TRINITY_DN13474_c0_g1~~TRINITY_DN13474_c0_g1_i1.p1  ORF type:complete len:408 (-),score=75.43 TRINITY_DN13474_c0_g1_i1:319-1542(-)
MGMVEVVVSKSHQELENAGEDPVDAAFETRWEGAKQIGALDGGHDERSQNPDPNNNPNPIPKERSPSASDEDGGSERSVLKLPEPAAVLRTPPSSPSPVVQSPLMSPAQNGYQVKRYSNGSRYAGQVQRVQRHGQGVYETPDGSRYEGEFHQGMRQGHGTQLFPSNAFYSGEWMNDQCHGIGTYTWASGQQYEGSFANDKRHGRGRMILTDGTVLEGEWERDMLDGLLPGVDLITTSQNRTDATPEQPPANSTPPHRNPQPSRSPAAIRRRPIASPEAEARIAAIIRWADAQALQQRIGGAPMEEDSEPCPPEDLVQSSPSRPAVVPRLPLELLRGSHVSSPRRPETTPRAPVSTRRSDAPLTSRREMVESSSIASSTFVAGAVTAVAVVGVALFSYKALSQRWSNR